MMGKQPQQLNESLHQDNSDVWATYFDGDEELDSLIQKMYDAVGSNLINEAEDDAKPYIEVNSILLQYGAGEAEYSDGVFKAIVDKKQQVTDICDILDELDYIELYEVIILEKTLSGSFEDDDVDFDQIDDSYGGYQFMIMIYLKIENVMYFDYYDQDEDEEEFDEEDSNMLMEVRRRIKIDSRGKKRIKMQCKPGYKWTGSACMKITGSELATKRKAKRKELINKKSQGSSFKIRMLRKSKKANRFRKAMGL